MHLKRIALHPERFPTLAHYPFNLPVLRQTPDFTFDTPVTLFVGENGSGKSTLLDEPETALSPRSQLELLGLLQAMGAAGHAQFIIATHSPILLACPGARLCSFDHIPARQVRFEETDHYRIYRDFLENPARHVAEEPTRSPPPPQ